MFSVSRNQPHSISVGQELGVAFEGKCIVVDKNYDQDHGEEAPKSPRIGLMMIDPNNNTHIDTLELDPADGQQYIIELRDRLLESLAPAQTIEEVEDRLRKLYPESNLVDLAIREASKRRGESSLKNHKNRDHSSSSGASFTDTLHNITSFAVAKVSNLFGDGVVGNKSENELTKYKTALIQIIIDDVLKLSGDFVRRISTRVIITRSDIRTAMHADKDLLDIFLSEDKSLSITENHPILAKVNCPDKTSQTNNVTRLTTYKQKVLSMVDSENSFIRGLKLIIKVFKTQLDKLPDIRADAHIIFCNIDELLELSNVLLSALEDALELASQEDSIPYVGSEILDLALAEEFHAYFTFAYKRLSRNGPWYQAYRRIVSNESIMNTIRMAAMTDQDHPFVLIEFDWAVRHLLPNYLLNTIVQFFEYFRNITDLYELSKSENHKNKEDELALKETISILIKTKKAIEEILEVEMNHEEIEPLDPSKAEKVRSNLEKKLDAALKHERESLPFMPPPHIYIFSEPDSKENITVDEKTNSIEKATLNKLVERLTYHECQPKIVDTFLITYREFSNPEELLDLLKARFNIPDPPLDVVFPNLSSPDDLSEYDRRAYKQYIKRFRQEYTKPVKMRVINVLKSWTKNHYYDFDDFERNPRLLEKLNSFLDEISNNEKVLQGVITPIKKTIEQNKRSNDDQTTKQKDDRIMLPHKPPPILWGTTQKFEEFDILTLHPVEFARQLTLIEFDLFRAIRPSELIKKDDRSQESPNLSKMTRHSTLLSWWIMKRIVTTQDLKERQAVYYRAIEVMEALRKLNNHAGLLSVGCAIESSQIRRLSKTREILTNTPMMKVLEDYRDLIENHHEKLQLELKKCNPPCIPFLGSYQTKLIHAKEGNKTFVDTTTISPTFSTDGFNSSSSISPTTPRTPQSQTAQTPVGSSSATSTNQDQFFPKNKLINFKKQRITAGLVAEISNYQNQPYCLEVQVQIKDFIKFIEIEMTKFAIELDPRSRELVANRVDDYMFEQSNIIEPRNRESCVKPKKESSKLQEWFRK